MTFTSTVFVLFFAVVYSAYLLLRRHHRAQNALLLVASAFFYGYWDWRFLVLLAVSTGIDYVVALKLEGEGNEKRRKWLLTFSLVSNLGILGVFKYFNFFVDSATSALQAMGLRPNPPTLDVVLPVGISFYTFQALSYTLDVYRRELPARRNFGDFLLSVLFFPHLVAGPIQRAASLLPQISEPRQIDAARIKSGTFLIVLGYFKKLVVADNAATWADTIFNNHRDYTSLDLVLGVFAFTLQIYGDFSGYSDIARGLARLMGFELMINFRLPYFATGPSDFWRRWHISLSEWLRDYLYIPLGGNRGGELRRFRNVTITMVLGGLWHGAAWNFVLWGAYHGALLGLGRAGTLLSARLGLKSPWGEAPRVLGMFVLTMFGWLLFRAQSLEQIGYFIGNAGFMPSARSAKIAGELLFYAAPLFALDVIAERKGDLLAPLHVRPAGEVAVWSAMIAWIAIFGSRESAEFIYFQF